MSEAIDAGCGDSPRRRRAATRASSVLIATSFVVAATSCKSAELIWQGEETVLRQPMGTPSPGAGVLVLAFDGLGRDLLYDELEGGRLPNLARLLGGSDGGRFQHAYLARDALTTFPSATAVAWASAFTGKAPAENGVTGNEMF